MELAPGQGIDWLVLDGQPVLFDENRQQLITFDGASWQVWRNFWGDDGRFRTVSWTNALETGVGQVARITACSDEQAFSFVQACLDQWRAAGLIDASPRPSTKRRKRQLQSTILPGPQSRFQRYRIADVSVSIENDKRLTAVVRSIFEDIGGHVRNSGGAGCDSDIAVTSRETYYLGVDGSGKKTLLVDPDEVVVWLKVAIMDRVLESHPSLIALHAAALSSASGTIVLAGPSGSGKSTLAAALNACGFSLIGEDVVFLDSESATVTGLPFAIAAKTGSWPILRPYFPDLDHLSTRIRPDGKAVKYLRPAIALGKSPISKVRWVIFPRYCPNSTTEFHSINKVEALVDILKEAENFPRVLTKSTFRILVRLLLGADVRRLCFGHLESALQSIRCLLPDSEEAREL